MVKACGPRTREKAHRNFPAVGAVTDLFISQVTIDDKREGQAHGLFSGAHTRKAQQGTPNNMTLKRQGGGGEGEDRRAATSKPTLVGS